ncbi:hypothetical protein ACFFX0_26155 [Citricoccus parietis]|uniref:Uncharacterized protein n=1 Tax=Citricoccus parietis TaxID=592307 RepID=A0ABV5G7U3_9MICC
MVVSVTGGSERATWFRIRIPWIDRKGQAVCRHSRQHAAGAVPAPGRTVPSHPRSSGRAPRSGVHRGESDRRPGHRHPGHPAACRADERG